MSGWSEHTGVAVSLPIDNIDTDQLIPARFMSRSRAEGYGDYLLHDMRRTPKPDGTTGFVLDTFPDATVLVTGRNFGSGSSREAAVYALVDAGIKTVIATSFGDIFTANATNNGLLTATVKAEDHALLEQCLDNASASATVNLAARTITLNNHTVPFQLDDVMTTKLINGWDDIDLTRTHTQRIAHYRAVRVADSPWTWPDISGAE